MKRSHYGTSGFQSFPNINANIKYGIKMKKNPMSVNVLGLYKNILNTQSIKVQSLN